MNFFNENNLIFVALNKIGDIILANLLFILCSIPLVTIWSFTDSTLPLYAAHG